MQFWSGSLLARCVLNPAASEKADFRSRPYHVRNAPPTSCQPFSKDEIKKVWEHQKEPWVDTVLILLYSGWRISELLNLKLENINLQAGTMKGGTKTKAGKDRVVSIHSKIRALVEARLAEGGPRLISYNGRVCSQTQY